MNIGVGNWACRGVAGIALLAAGLATVGAARADQAPTPEPASPPSSPPAAPTREQILELHAAAQSLWDAFAPDSVKAEYELISADELLALLQRVTKAGAQQDLKDYAALAPETRAAIAALQAMPDYADYADWLRQQLADMEVAQEVVTPPPSDQTAKPPPPPPVEAIPLYERWVRRVAQQPRPPQADELLPVLRAAFVAEGVPEALVWLAETESSFNPKARSPAGARGLFQLMPDTAKALGLSLLPFDQRTQPQASARATAAYLKKLHTRFGDWPLALAAYNGGEGRVSRTLKERRAKDFAGIAEHLPAETRLYVPKVLATVRVRTGVTPDALATSAAEATR